MRAILISFLVLAGCSDEQPGKLSNPCYANLTCDTGLTCIAWSEWVIRDYKYVAKYNFAPTHKDLGSNTSEEKRSVCADTETMKIMDLRRGQ